MKLSLGKTQRTKPSVWGFCGTFLVFLVLMVFFILSEFFWVSSVVWRFFRLCACSLDFFLGAPSPSRDRSQCPFRRKITARTASLLPVGAFISMVFLGFIAYYAGRLPKCSLKRVFQANSSIQFGGWGRPFLVPLLCFLSDPGLTRNLSVVISN
ncbi:MAG: hypothetical protein CM15mP95_2750 [Alphaproteobacteria bacterium]|nr:MAG: hypothetical protein CM15mP95_2750 [Alphaproteobacteria bacterium]